MSANFNSNNEFLALNQFKSSFMNRATQLMGRIQVISNQFIQTTDKADAAMVSSKLETELAQALTEFIKERAHYSTPTPNPNQHPQFGQPFQQPFSSPFVNGGLNPGFEWSAYVNPQNPFGHKPRHTPWTTANQPETVQDYNWTLVFHDEGIQVDLDLGYNMQRTFQNSVLTFDEKNGLVALITPEMEKIFVRVENFGGYIFRSSSPNDTIPPYQVGTIYGYKALELLTHLLIKFDAKHNSALSIPTRFSASKSDLKKPSEETVDHGNWTIDIRELFDISPSTTVELHSKLGTFTIQPNFQLSPDKSFILAKTVLSEKEFKLPISPGNKINLIFEELGMRANYSECFLSRRLAAVGPHSNLMEIFDKFLTSYDLDGEQGFIVFSNGFNKKLKEIPSKNA